MKKISENEVLLTSAAQENLRMDEANAYLEFSKKFFKEQGVSGPFDKKAPKDLMKKLSEAWKKEKEKKGDK
jgi:hypothetical protein